MSRQRRTRYIIKGYVVRYAPRHPLAPASSGTVPEHRMGLYDHLGVGPHPCHWCGSVCEWHELHVDHLDHDRQHNTAENLVVARPKPPPPPSSGPPPRSDWFRYVAWRKANDVCAECGTNLHAAGVNEMAATYCSNACRQRAYRRRRALRQSAGR